MWCSNLCALRKTQHSKGAVVDCIAAEIANLLQLCCWSASHSPKAAGPLQPGGGGGTGSKGEAVKFPIMMCSRKGWLRAKAWCSTGTL